MAYFPDYDPATAGRTDRLIMGFESLVICGHCTLKYSDECPRPPSLHPNDPGSYRYDGKTCEKYSPRPSVVEAGELACMTKLHQGIIK